MQEFINRLNKVYSEDSLDLLISICDRIHLKES